MKDSQLTTHCLLSLSGSIIFSLSITGVHSTIFSSFFERFTAVSSFSKGGVCRLGQSAEWRGERQGSHGAPGAEKQPRTAFSCWWSWWLWRSGEVERVVRILPSHTWLRLVTWELGGNRHDARALACDRHEWYKRAKSYPKLAEAATCVQKLNTAQRLCVWPCGWEWTFGKLRSTMYAGVTFEWGKDACNPSKAHGDDWRCIWPWLFVDMKFIEVPRYVHIIGYDRMWSLWCCECCATFWNVYSGFDDFCDRLGQHGGRSASTLAASYRPAMACKPESKGCRFKSLSRQCFCFSLKIVESCFCQIWGISAEINFKISKIFQNCWRLFASHFSVRQLHVGQCLRGLCFSFLSSLKTGEMLEKIA